jgi:hypothetical protein
MRLLATSVTVAPLHDQLVANLLAVAHVDLRHQLATDIPRVGQFIHFATNNQI